MKNFAESGLHRTQPAPPVRIVHLGLGAFSRSHIAWYTAHASDSAEWGIAAYTGSSTELAESLTSQDGVYTLISRSAQADAVERVESIVRAHSGSDLAQLLDDLSAPATAIVSLTITEAGYRADANGRPDSQDPLVRSDRQALASVSTRETLGDVEVVTALGRLVLGLEARRRSGAGPLALISCDNLPDNGGLLRSCVLALAAEDSELGLWCANNLSFVSSSVDRITPRVDEHETRRLSERFDDRAPVVAESFSDWVISGEFLAGRPRWESAGARFTDDLEPWEARKLWLLNGAHTILACLGRLRGHESVSEAIADPGCRQAVDAFWDEAARNLPDALDIPAYRDALLDRFSNARIVHSLAQIGLGTPLKLRLRIAPVAELERAAGRSACGAAVAFASWLALETGSLGVDDLRGQIQAVSPVLAADDVFLNAVLDSHSELVAGVRV